MSSIPKARNSDALSRELAELAGLSLRVQVARGTLTRDSEVFHWFKCPRHNTWLQPVRIILNGHELFWWQCAVQESNDGGVTNFKTVWRCDFKRAAKFRTRIEREVFRIWRYLEEHG